MWKQSEAKQSTDKHVTDIGKKTADQDSGTIDSGFISSANLILSSTDLSSENLSSYIDEGQEAVDAPFSKSETAVKDPTAVDSGLDLSICESLSMNLQQVSLNPLQGKNQAQSEPALQPIGDKEDDNVKEKSLPLEVEKWKIFYGQNSDGDT